MQTMSNNKVDEEEEDYITYSKLKESHKTLSRPSNSNFKDLNKNFKTETENEEVSYKEDLVEM